MNTTRAADRQHNESAASKVDKDIVDTPVATTPSPPSPAPAWVKTLAHTIGYLLALPNLIGYAIGKPVLGEVRAFGAASERVGAKPGHIGMYIRQRFYRHALAHVGCDVQIGYCSVFTKAQARIGDRVYVGRFCSIGWADVGDDVMLADGVQILSGRYQHGHGPSDDKALRDNKLEFTKVTIGKGAWLGAGAIIMADVGEKAIVGAGAVVIKPVPPGAKVGGVPAQSLTAVTRGKSFT